MKRIIRLTAAVLFCISVFSVTASAEESINAEDAFESAANIVAVNCETIKTEEILSESIVPEEQGTYYGKSAENSFEEETDTCNPVPGGDIATGENEETVPTAEENQSPEGDPGENPAGNISEILDGILPTGGDENSPESGSETAVTPTDTGLTESEESEDSDEYVLSGENIKLANGIYSYQLVIDPPEKLTFDNDLENSYQGVDGRYRLHYEIAEFNNHIMVSTGLFKNIMTASPLLTMFRVRISDDSYSYRLNLRTNEGFSFTNNLKYIFDGEKRGYSIYYNYDLLTNKQTFEINEPHDEDEEFWQQKIQFRKRHSIFSDYIFAIGLFDLIK